jgi:hypothetical protein
VARKPTTLTAGKRESGAPVTTAAYRAEGHFGMFDLTAREAHRSALLNDQNLPIMWAARLRMRLWPIRLRLRLYHGGSDAARQAGFRRSQDTFFSSTW